MIDINLVPENLRKKRKKGGATREISALPKDTLFGVGGGFLLLLLIINVLFQAGIYVKNAQLKRYKKQWNEILPEKTNVDKILEALQNVRGKVSSIEESIGTDRILWSQKFNEVSDNTVKGVWLNKIELAENILIMHGSAVSKDNTEILSAHKFLSNLKNDENFKRHFSDIEIGVHKTSKLYSVSIADFTISATLEQ